MDASPECCWARPPATLANTAYCPVALIRSHKDTSTADTGWIAVIVDDSPDNHAVSQHGFEEAVFRNAPLIALGVWRWDIDENLDDRLETRLARYPDVRV